MAKKSKEKPAPAPAAAPAEDTETETTYLLPSTGMVHEGQVLTPEELANNPEALKKLKAQKLSTK